MSTWWWPAHALQTAGCSTQITGAQLEEDSVDDLATMLAGDVLDQVRTALHPRAARWWCCILWRQRHVAAGWWRCIPRRQCPVAAGWWRQASML